MTKPPTRRTPKAKPSASRLPLASPLDKPARRKVAADRPVAQPTGRGKERSVVYLESSLPCSTDWHGIAHRRRRAEVSDRRRTTRLSEGG